MIEFAHSARLWGLGLGVLILLLALPPRPQREVLTAYLPQWLRALARHRRAPLRYPWTRTLLLLLAFAAAVLAWSRPRVPSRPGPTRLRVIVDASASLLAEQGGGTAWAALQAALQQQLAVLPAHVRAAVEIVRCDRVVQFVADAHDLGAPAPCGLAMDLARVVAAAGSVDTAVWTLTDGQGPLPPAGALTVLGRAHGNVGITALHVDDRWPLPEVEVAVEVANFSPSAHEVTVEVASGEGTIATVPAPVAHTIASGARELVRHVLRRARGGTVTVRIATPPTAADALAADDAVAWVLPPPPAPRIAVLSDSDAPVLRAAAEALAAETGGEVVSANEGDARVSFVLVEGGAQRAADWADLPGLTFGTRLLAEGEQLAAPPALIGEAFDWDRSDARTRGLDFSELRVARAAAAVPGVPLVLHASTPLVSRSLSGKAVHCAFRLVDSNLWLLPAFPQLLRRCYAAAHAEVARVLYSERNVVDARESDLRALPAPAHRPLPTFGSPAVDLTAWFALGALVLLAVRVWVTRGTMA